MGSKSDNFARMGVLYGEHALLGADFSSSDDGSVIRVVSYPSEKGGPVDSGRAYLHDLSGSSYVLVSGPHASDLIEAAFCGPKISVGESAWQCALTAEGGLTSVPLVIRTGANEYVLLDPSDRGDVVVAWLGFLSQIEQNGFAPYAGTKVEEATDMLTPLLMAGNAATMSRIRAISLRWVRSRTFTLIKSLPSLRGSPFPASLSRFSCCSSLRRRLLFCGGASSRSTRSLPLVALPFVVPWPKCFLGAACYPRRIRSYPQPPSSSLGGF